MPKSPQIILVIKPASGSDVKHKKQMTPTGKASVINMIKKKNSNYNNKAY